MPPSCPILTGVQRPVEPPKTDSLVGNGSIELARSGQMHVATCALHGIVTAAPGKIRLADGPRRGAAGARPRVDPLGHRIFPAHPSRPCYATGMRCTVSSKNGQFLWSRSGGDARTFAGSRSAHHGRSVHMVRASDLFSHTFHAMMTHTPSRKCSECDKRCIRGPLRPPVPLAS